MDKSQPLNLASIVSTLQNAVQAINSLNQTLNNLLPNGAYILFPEADTAAPTNSIYYSTTQNKAVYKDSTGNVHVLY